MSSEPISRRSRRSTRVPLRVLIEVQYGAESLTGETIIVNLHGALLLTSIEFKRANAEVVHIDPENPMRCGIELDKPRNIWGVPLPPGDWEEAPEP